MSRSTKQLFMSAAAAAFLLAACAPSGVPDAGAAGSGGVLVTIPAVSPLLTAGRHAASRVARASDGSAGSRMFMGRDRVEIFLIDSESNVVDRQTVFNENLAMAADNIELFAPAGEGYTVRADIYNTLSSGTSPMCRGTSDPFDILAGLVSSPSVICRPVSPTAITLGSAVGPVALVPGITNLDYPEYTVGQEAWYSFVAGSASTTVTMIPTVVGQPGFYVGVIGSDGNWVIGFEPAWDVMSGGTPAQGDYSFDIATTEGQTYYVVLATFDYEQGGEIVLRGNGCTFTVENTP